MKKLAIILLSVILFSCAEDEPIPQVDGNKQNKVSFNGQDILLPRAVVTRFNDIGTGQYNMDLELHDGTNSTFDAENLVYFELNSSDSTKISEGNYTFDPNWGPETFRLCNMTFTIDGQIRQYAFISGFLDVEESVGRLDCNFDCLMYNIQNNSDTIQVIGVYEGETVFVGVKGAEQD